MIDTTNKQLFTYQDLFPTANEALMKVSHFEEYHKFGKRDIGIWLRQNGYIRIRKMINGISRYYYYKD